MGKKTFFAIMAFLSFTFVVGVALEIFASAPRARNISIFRIDGADARIARSSGGRETTAREDQRINCGNVISTGRNTQTYFALVDEDVAAIWKMDVSSRVQVSTVRRRLALTLSLGNALVNVTNQEAGHSTYVIIGNTAFSVRGTMFTIGKTDEGSAQIVMLSGEGVVEMPGADGRRVEVSVAAGEMITIYENGIATVPQPITMEALPLFTLEEIINNYEYLLGVGTITEHDLVEASHLIPILRQQREEDRAYWDSHIEMLRQQNPPDVVLFPFDEYEFVEVVIPDNVPFIDDDGTEEAELPELIQRADAELAPITITWNPNGGSVSPSSSTMPPGSMHTSPTPTRSGFVFVGWFDTYAPTGGIQLSQPFAAPYENATFWARWAEEPAEMMTVTWHPNGGSFPGQGLNVTWEWELTAGQGFLREPYSLMPERSGFIFEGWFDTSAATGGNRVTTGSPVPSVNATFWARWSPEPVGTVTITWNATGGSVSPGSSSLTPGSQFATLPTPTRSGHVFEGWFDTSAAIGGTQLTHASIVPDSNAQFWARWVAEVSYVAIVWNMNPPPGTLVPWPAPTQTFEAPGTQFSTIPTPQFDVFGYSFEGWFTTNAVAGGTQITHTSIVPNADTNFWARWTRVHAVVDIAFHAHPGIIQPTNYWVFQQIPGTPLTISPFPWAVQDGYTFAGWWNTIAPTGGTQITQGSIVPNVHTTFYARWTPDFIPVTHISGVPSSFPVGSQSFTVEIHPGNATNAGAGIIWSVEDPGGTGATVSGSTFTTHFPGTMRVLATIPNGRAVGIDFTYSWWIAVH